MNDVARLHVCAKSHILCGFYWKAAMSVHGSLGPSRCSRSINEHQHIFGIRLRRQCILALSGYQFVPPVISSLPPIHVDSSVFQDDEMFQGRKLFSCLIGN